MTIALCILEPERRPEPIDTRRGPFVAFALFRFTLFSERNKRMPPSQPAHANYGGFGFRDGHPSLFFGAPFKGAKGGARIVHRRRDYEHKPGGVSKRGWAEC